MYDDLVEYINLPTAKLQVMKDKVYVITGYSDLSNNSYIDSVFYNKDKAQLYVNNHNFKIEEINLLCNKYNT